MAMTDPATSVHSLKYSDAGTGTETGGAFTLNKRSGVITTAALTTAAAATYTLTLTNSAIAAADLVFFTVAFGTNVNGNPSIVKIQPAAGSVVIIIKNVHAANAFDGTLKIGFIVVKQ